MTSAGICRGSCLPWAVRYRLCCYFMGLDFCRLPKTQLRSSLISLGSAKALLHMSVLALRVVGHMTVDQSAPNGLLMVAFKRKPQEASPGAVSCCRQRSRQWVLKACQRTGPSVLTRWAYRLISVVGDRHVIAACICSGPDHATPLSQ